jgi:hypothetical protein
MDQPGKEVEDIDCKCVEMHMHMWKVDEEEEKNYHRATVMAWSFRIVCSH